MIFLLILKEALGWWCNGHMVTAIIAQQQFQIRAPIIQQTIQSILSPLYGKLTHNLVTNFVQSACWPDDIKDFRLTAMDYWQYIDKPYNFDGFLYPSGNSTNLLWAIGESLKTLGYHNQQEGIMESSIMMMYLINLIGKLHSPVSVANYWSSVFPGNDERGKKFSVDFNANIENLSDLWDSGLGVMEKSVDRPLSDEGSAQIEEWALWSMGNYTRESLDQELSVKNRTLWSDQTFQVAVDSVYKGASPGFTPSSEYLEQGWKMAMKQMALGGYRLADILIDLYSDSISK